MRKQKRKERKKETRSLLRQNLSLLFNLLPKIHRSAGITARQQRQFARRIIDKHVGEAVAAHDIGDLFLGLGVAGAQLVEINRFELLARVADEVEEEEEGWMGVRGLH